MAVSTITEQSFTEAAKSQLRKLMHRQLHHMSQISSGQKIQEVSDDPEGVGRAMRFFALKQESEQYKKNAAQAESIAETGFNSLREMRGLLVQAQEQALKSNSEQASDQNFATGEAVLNTLIDSAINSANSKYLKDYLFSGTATDTKPYVETRDASGNVTSVSFQGNTDTTSFYISDTTKVSVFGKGTVSNDLLTSINHLITLRDALAAKDPAAVQSITKDLVDVEARISDGTVDYSAIINQVEVSQFQNDHKTREADKQISKDISADLAEVYVEFGKDKIAYEGATKVNSYIIQRSSILNYL